MPETLPTTRPASPLARPQQQVVGGLQNADETDIILPRLHLFQGLPSEREQYGDHKPGTFTNVMTGEIVDATRPFAVITGWKEWIKWREPRGSGIEYRTREKSQVPPGDLEWNQSETDPANCKPRATEYINWVIVFEGDTVPQVLSFFSTGTTTGKSIQSMQGIYGPTQMYAISLVKKSNAKGTWLGMVVRPAGKTQGEFGDFIHDAQQRFAGRHVDIEPEEELPI